MFANSPVQHDESTCSVALRKCERQFTETQALAHLGSWEWDLATNEIQWSDELYGIYGIKPGHAAVLPGFFDRGDSLEIVQALAAGEARDLRPFDFEDRIVRPDGAVRFLRTRGEVIFDENGAPVRVVGTSLDVTEQRMAEAALRLSEQRFTYIFRSNPAPMSMTTPDDGRLVDLNDRCCEFLCLERSTAVGRTTTELGLWVNVVEREAVIRTLKLTGTVQDMEVQLRSRSGQVLDVLLSMELIETPGEEAPVVLSTFRDITERKAAELQLAHEQNLMRTLLDNIPDQIYVKDLQGRFVLTNQANARTLGLPSTEEAVGKTAFDFFPAEIARQYAADDARVVESAEPLIDREEPFVTASGSDGWFLTTKVPLRDAQGRVNGLVGISRDITEKKRMEEQFLRAQRLDCIGALASGLAHDLNNILAPIIMGAQLLELSVQTEDDRQMLATIISNVRRCADIVQQLLTFSRGQSGQVSLVQARDVLLEVAKIATETFPRSIGIETQIADDLWPVMGDATQFHQVLLNLCVNARDAMPNGGRILIRAENVTADECFAAMVPEAKPGRLVLLSVHDDGVGIPPQIMDKIFDPFFSTKEPGKGTGLGLSTAHSIIKTHGGFIRVESEPGKGSMFKVYLPAAAEAGSLAPEPLSPPPIHGQGETILLVEDELIIRELTARMLTRHGYNVKCACDGVDALVAFGKYSGEIDLVLTDINMPNMPGNVLIQALSKMAPELKFIVMTGADHQRDAAAWRELGADAFIQKPFSFKTILAVIRDVISCPK